MSQMFSQRRAKHALQAIQKFAQESNSAGKSKEFYLMAIKSVPMEIRANGMGQAMAMALSQSERGNQADRKAAFKTIYDHFQGWLCDPHEPDTPFDRGDLMTRLCEAEQELYLHAQTEALAYAAWLKKFANAFLATSAPNPAETTP
ncbi:MAG: type III-B CRISPR module-associated protein Cmr5 [Magnetococcus sp. YQC-9]